MKKIAMILLAFSAITFSAGAQEKKEMKGGFHGHQFGKHHGHGMLAKQLNFSDDQKKQAKAIGEDFRKQMQELNKKENITVKQQRDQRESLMKARKAKMDALLTPEQKTKLAQLKADRKQKAEEQYAKRLDRMKTNLGLSDDQVAQLKTQRQAMHDKFKAIKENENLSRTERRDKLMALRNEAKEQNKKIFTADQLKKMEDMHKKHFDKQETK